MFERDLNGKKTGDPVKAPAVDALGQDSGYRFYAMPTQYYRALKPPSKVGKILVITTAILLVVGLLGVAGSIAYVAYVENQLRPLPPTPSGVVNTNANTAPTPRPSTSTATNTNTVPPQATTSTSTASTSTPTTPPVVTPTPPNVTRGVDSDQDGLSDAEEALFQSNASNVDSDRDGFTDGQELVNGFSPTVANETLRQAGTGGEYQDTLLGYNLVYPRAWTITRTSSKTSFRSLTGEIISIQVFTNQTLDPAAWLQQQQPVYANATLNPVSTASFKGIQTANALYTVLQSNTRTGVLIVIQYELASRQVVEYTAVLGLMVNSLQL